MKRISLRLKIMLMTTLMMMGIAVCLTWTAIDNAQKYYIEHAENNSYNVTRDLNGQKLNSNNKEGLSIFYKLTSESATQYFIKKSLFYMIGICLIGIILLYFMIDTALKPLVKLDETVKQINENNLNQRIEIKSGNNEIVSLTQSFNKMLTRLEKSFVNQKRFVANVTHELKTPLTIIKTDIEVLKLDEEPTVEDYKDNLEVIEKSTQRLIYVVDNLLELMDESKEQMDEIIAVDELIIAILEELENRIKQKHIMIYKWCENCYVKGNTTLLYRALFNLIENAIKYNKDNGFIKIDIKTLERKVFITVEDNGMGIPESCITNIFEAFYRVDSSRSRDLGGAGLGLSLVKHIIEKHKGRIRVESKEGEGTLFEVQLIQLDDSSIQRFKSS